MADEPRLSPKHRRIALEQLGKERLRTQHPGDLRRELERYHQKAREGAELP